MRRHPARAAGHRRSGDPGGLAVETHDRKATAISVYELSGANSLRRRTFGGNNRVPVWSADGQRVAFESDPEGDRAIFWQPRDGGPAERLTRPEPGTIHTPESWGPRSDVLLFRDERRGDDAVDALNQWPEDVSLRRRDLGRRANLRRVLTGRPLDRVSGWRTQFRRGWTYVQPFPPTGARHQIARRGRPMWSAAGKDLELFFVPAPGQFKAVTVRTQPTFGFTNPVDVPRRFAVAFPGNPRPYDVLPDGRLITVWRRKRVR